MLNSANPVLITRSRGKVAECTHRGSIALVDGDGTLQYRYGDPFAYTFPRSSLKPYQALPLIWSGAYDHFGFTPQELAIACGSHSGEAKHVETVLSMLGKIGLGPEALGCGSQQPNLTQDREDLIRAGEKPSALHNNCSGKHTGFLAVCQKMGFPIEGYLEPEHPLQIQIKNIVAQGHRLQPGALHLGIDGCSAPNYAMPLYNIALGMVNLPELEGGAQIVEAMTSHPYMVAGSKRYCTMMMDTLEGRVLGKTGADGVFVLLFVQEKKAVAIKVDDGMTGAQFYVAQSVLAQSGLFSEEQLEPLEAFHNPDIKNWAGITTGRVEVAEREMADLASCFS